MKTSSSDVRSAVKPLRGNLLGRYVDARGTHVHTGRPRQRGAMCQTGRHQRVMGFRSNTGLAGDPWVYRIYGAGVRASTAVDRLVLRPVLGTQAVVALATEQSVDIGVAVDEVVAGITVEE